MRTVRSLASFADRAAAFGALPRRSLAIGLVLVVAAVLVFALVDRVVPPPAPPAAQPPGAAAEKSARPAPRLEPSPVSAGPLVAIAATIGGAVVLLWFLKRALKGSRHLPGAQKVLKVRDVLMMGPKRAIYLIALEDRNLVVGVSGDVLTLLSEYSSETAEPQAESPALAAAESVPNARTGEFATAPAAEPAPAAAPIPSAVAALPIGRLDVEIGDDEPSARASTRPAAPRTFPFGAVSPDAARPQKSRSDRVPHKFRQLLEKAAQAEGGTR
jgi:flagellar biogenesis protein FliO